MASEAQKKQKQWDDYCDNLAKAGFLPPESVQRGYAQSSQFWNTVDTEANTDFENAISSLSQKGTDAR